MPVEVVVDEREFRRAGIPQRRKLRELAHRLRVEPYFGDRIRVELVPRPMRNLPNLLRLELPDGWRALYTVISTRRGHHVRILWIGDHKRYERLFGY